MGYVLCLPLHLELIQSYRSMRRCAEDLAAAGFHVLRVHYEGTQESIGSTDHDPDRVARWLDSVHHAVDAMKGVPGVETVGLIGVRIGGTFALAATTKSESISHLVLWEPASGAAYGRELEILAASNQHAIRQGRAPAEGSAVNGIVVGGYWLSQDTISELSRLDPLNMEPRRPLDVLFVHRDDRRPSTVLRERLDRSGCRTTLRQIGGHKEMMAMPQQSKVPADIIAGIRDWAVEHSRSLGTQRVDGPRLEPEVVVDGVRWRAVRFGSASHLFGVIAESESGAASGATGVLLLTGGVTPRTAGNQSYVTLARRLASRGHAVLRMDVSSIGESATPNGAAGNDTDPYPPSILDDARAGFDLISTATGGGGVWVLGLCSGAYAAFQVALGDQRACGALLLNPERFERGDESSGPRLSTADQIGQVKAYGEKLRDLSSWKRLLSGKTNIRHAGNLLRARVASKLALAQARVAARLGLTPVGLSGDLDRLLTRGLTLGLVFSEGDPGHSATVAELQPQLVALEEKGLIMKVIQGADHNFHEIASRAEMLEWVAATISGLL
ncbi:MAG: hypothetical protein AB7T31_09560 [Gemmatimonadales bacterium]